MTNKTTLEALIREIDKPTMSRADFSLHFIETIELLENIPFSIIDES